MLAGGYTRAEVLARDPDGALFVAEDQATGEPVLVQQGLSDRTRRFLRELVDRVGGRDVPALFELRWYPSSDLDWVVWRGTSAARPWSHAGHRTLPDILRDALATARALGHVHDLGLVHGRLCPEHIFLRDGQAYLVGLVGPLPLPVAEPGVRSPFAPYAAPELDSDTRPIDARADLYALGVLLFEALHGAPPFRADDDLTLRHHHVAHVAPSLDVHPEVPEVLARVVEQLLRKDPDDRYATATGVAADLERILTLYRHLGAVPAFELGAVARSERLTFPSVLLGRESEEAELAQCLARARQGAFVLVRLSGTAGIGRTALARTLLDTTVAAGGWFGRGETSPDGSRGVYQAWTESLTQVLQQVLAEPPHRIERIEHAVRDAMGNQGGLLIGLVPQLASLLGEQPQPTTLQGSEAKARLSRRMGRLLGALATPTHPLVLVLEDVHWADRASVDLILPWLEDPTLGHLLIVITDRPDAMSPSLDAALHGLESRDAFHTLTLGPLDPSATRRWVGTVLERTDAEAVHFAQRLHQKTQGNPLALRQTVAALHQRGVLFREAGAWTWDPEAVEATAVPDTIAAIMAERLFELPEATREAMAHAACLGSDVSLEQLARVMNRATRPDNTLLQHLEPAAQAGMITLRAAADRIAFPHDRVRQAALAGLPEDRRRRIHHEAGRELLAHHGGQVPADTAELFQLLGHLHRSPEGLEPTLLASLDLEAATRSHRTLAFEQAREHVVAGIQALGPDGWSDHYPLALALHQLAAEVALHLGDAVLHATSGDAVLVHARNPLDRVPVHLLSIREDLAAGRWDQSTDTAVQTLHTLGVRLPRRPTKAHVVAELTSTWSATRGRPIAEHATLDATGTPLDLAIDELLVWCATAGYFAAPDLVPVCGLRMATLAARRGVGPHSAFGFALMAMVNAGVLERTDDAMAWADAAEALMSRFPDGALAGKVGLLVDGFSRGWARPLRDHIPRLLDRRAEALDVGDTTFAVYCGAAAYYNAFAAGWTLDLIEERFERVVEHAYRSDQTQAWPMFASWGQLHACLRDPAHRSGALSGDRWDWASARERLLDEGDGNGLAHSATAAGQLAYLMGDIPAALEALRLAHRWIEAILSQLVVATHRAYYTLALLAAAHEARGLERWRLRRQAGFHAWRFRRWAERNPTDLSGLLAILEAEAMAVDGRLVEALARWQEAAHLARVARRDAEVALALERAGTWAARAGLGQVARNLLMDARSAWDRVQAHAKVQQLTETYALPRMETSSPSDEAPLLSSIRALSAEIELNRVLTVLLEQVLHISNAQRVVLLLERDHGLEVVAERDVLDEVPRLQVAEPLADRPDLPAPVFNYARRTQRSLYLPDAPAHELYPRSPSLAHRGVRCLLCLPLQAHGQLRGLLYLEHRLLREAIDPRQRAVLEALCAQATVSLENAALYADVDAALSRARADRTQLEAALHRIQVSSVSIQRLGSILEGISDAVLVFDARQDLSYANAAALAMFGSDGMDTLLDDLDATLDERWLDTARGRIRVRIATGELLDADGHPRGTVFSIVDVSERYRTEEALRAARAAAEAASRSKSAFLANMSHELRTPLNAIIGYADLLEEECGDLEPADLRTDLVRIRSSGQHLLQLINDILDLSKIEADRMDVVVGDHTARALWDGIHDAARILAAENANKLDVQLDDVPDSLRCDALRATQILLNLLSNASKFTSEGRITVAAQASPTHIGLSVRDTGIGMTEEQVDRIFDAFQQAEATTSHTYGGTGLGLTLSRKLARLMGGDLEVDTAPGQGSAFTLWLPRSSVAPADLPAARPIERTPEGAGRRPVPTSEGETPA